MKNIWSAVDDDEEPPIPPAQRSFADKITWARLLGFDLIEHKIRQCGACRGAVACYRAIAEHTVSRVLTDVRRIVGAGDDDDGAAASGIPRD